jgi:glycosyltransferase involved in cell wall biosynthesis/SAM-dependent methyltransferase
MRVVIDMQGAQTESRFRGIGRYTLSLTTAIARNRGNHEIILALNGLFPETIEPIRAAFDGLLPQENIRVWHAPGPVRECDPGNRWRRKVAERIREGFLASLRPDVVLVSSLFEGIGDDAVTSIGVLDVDTPVAVILYDLIPLISPDIHFQTSNLHKDYYSRKLASVRKAHRLLAISANARLEAVHALGFDARHVVNISGACDSSFRMLDMSAAEKQDVCRNAGIAKPFVMYAGGADERKNLYRLIQAYTLLPANLRASYQLALVGKMPQGNVDALLLAAKKHGLAEHEVVFTGYVDDPELVRLYNACSLFVFPSLHEGFGLPPLEAMRCGTAVIASNTTSLPEVIGHEEAMFDPDSVTSIKDKLERALTDKAFRDSLVAHGRIQAAKFSWEESARGTIAVMESLHLDMAGRRDVRDPKDVFPRLVDAIAAAVPSAITDAETLHIAQLLSRDHPNGARRQLMVDVSELAQRDSGSGVQRVTRSILRALLESPPKGYVVEPVYSTLDDPVYRYARQFTARFCGSPNNRNDEQIDYHPGDIFLGLDLQHFVVINHRDYLASLRRDGVKVVFVVYDLLPVLMPTVFESHVEPAHKQLLEVVLSFDGAVCISRTVAEELADWQRTCGLQRLRPFQIGWFHLGSDVENSAPTRGLSDDHVHVLGEIARRPTFLTVGTIEPRKGHAQLLDGFELLWTDGVDANLVIVGKQGWKVDTLVKRLRSHSENNKRLFWLKGISDEYLERVYTASSCLIAASEGEGFGLPLIEAAQHKLPIIARDLPVFREVAGEHALYFSGREPRPLATAIRQWLELNQRNQAPQSQNMPRLTWKQSAEQLMRVALNGHAQPRHGDIHTDQYSPQDIGQEMEITDRSEPKASLTQRLDSLVLELRSNPAYRTLRERARAEVMVTLKDCAPGDANPSEMVPYVAEAALRFHETANWIGDALDLVSSSERVRLLEVGANPYFQSIIIKERFPSIEHVGSNYFGSDSMANQYQTQKVVDPKGRLNEARYLCADVERHPLSQLGTVDIALFCEVIEHLPYDPCWALYNIVSTLRPGGVLILTTPNPRRLENIHRLVAKDGNYSDPISGYGLHGRHNREYTIEELGELVESTGLRVIRTRTLDTFPTDISKSAEEKGYGSYLMLLAILESQPRLYRPSWLYRSFGSDKLASPDSISVYGQH